MTIKARIFYVLLFIGLNVIGNSIGSAFLAILALPLVVLVIIPALSRITKLDLLQSKISAWFIKFNAANERAAKKYDEERKKKELEKAANKSLKDLFNNVNDDLSSRVASVSNWNFFGEIISAKLIDEFSLSEIDKDMINNNQFLKIYRIIEVKFKGDIYESLESDYSGDNTTYKKDKSKLVKNNADYNFRFTCEQYFNIVGNIEDLKGKDTIKDIYEDFNVAMNPGENELDKESMEMLKEDESFNNIYIVNRGTYIDLFDLNRNIFLWKETGFDEVVSGKKPRVGGNNISFEKAIAFQMAISLKMYPGFDPLDDEDKEKAYHEGDFANGVIFELPLVQAPK